MKFARYLEDTQVPEWERAYINYRGLKKCIKQIIKSRAGLPHSSTVSLGNGSQPDIPRRSASASILDSPVLNTRTHYGSVGNTPPISTALRPSSPPNLTLSPSALGDRSSVDMRNNGPSSLRTFRSEIPTPQAPPSSRRPAQRRATFSLRGMRKSEDIMITSSSIAELLSHLSPVEIKFFDTLDGELEKVESFYKDREKDALIRAAILKEQLRELQDHRKAFHDLHKDDPNQPWGGVLWSLRRIGNGEMSVTPTNSHGIHHPHLVHDPEEYQRAKRRLKKAVLEFYRGLELLNNYRILNITGFRKALKKFEKTTRIGAQVLYMREKVEPCGFNSDETIRPMMESIELLYAARFEGGDKKKARTRLRAHFKSTTHHFSTWRSGMYTGLAIPALGLGIYEAFRPNTHVDISQWGPLLQVYLALLLPVVFILLIGLNIIVWARSRINHVFIFELDVRTAIDPREFFEFPAFLFLTLSYAFCLSFTRVGFHEVAPTTWPLVWIILALILMFNPIPIFFKESRFWLIKISTRLLLSGFKKVEFADFWLGDQLCSLKYTLANLYFIGCAYSEEWHDVYQTCGITNQYWVGPFLLASLPSILRLLQCIKRYQDSGLKAHLINGGKYTGNVIVGITYYYWRHRGSRHDHTFALYCLCATFDSTYTSSWDLLMDWSLLKPHAPFRFLRPSLLYTSAVPVYYFAIISNVMIRFIWVWYLVPGPLNAATRGFIFACLEILRRVQWNFLRLENEHLGNSDQYRATREVPLPYSFDEHESEEEEVMSNKTGGGRKILRRRSVRMSSVGISSSAGSPRG